MAMIDRDGLVHSGRPLSAEKAEFAIDPVAVPPGLLAAGGQVSLADVIEHRRPTVLIGTTGTGGRFDEATIRALSGTAARPVVMALSNPTSACEATPTDVLRWSDGRAVVATGSPFDPVRVNDAERPIGQANNAFVFPGLGLGAVVAEAREITDDMLLAAARTLAQSVSAGRLNEGTLYPPISDLGEVAHAIACAVVREARESGFGRHLHDEEIEPAVEAATWKPEYVPLPV